MPVLPPRGSVAALCLLATFPLGAEMVTLPPVADTSLWELDPDFNFGGQWTLPAGAIGRMFPANQEVARALYKFELAGAIPDRCTIDSARLKLTIAIRGTPENGRASDFALSRVLVDWGEGLGRDDNPGGADALPGEATWNNRFHPDTPWSTPGGEFGVDFAPGPVALVANVTGNREVATTYLFNFNATGLAELQGMVEGTLANHGWVLYSLDEESRRTARRWTSREARLADHGPIPELEITWSVPVPAISVDLDAEARELCVRCEALLGFSYQLQCGADLETWAPGETRVPTEDGELVFRLPLDPAAKYVRVESTKLP